MKRKLTELQKEKLTACIVGCAVGDAIGLPFEGMRPKSIAKVLKGKKVRHCLLGKYGMWSDDTDHSIMLAQSLMFSSCSDDFVKSFSRKLKLWFLALPPGIGLGTARSIIKSFLGFKHSGVFSAGNGPCMRAASLGVIFKDDSESLAQYNALQTKVTHTDPKAQVASRAIVELAAHLMDSLVDIDSLEGLILKETDVEWEAIVKPMLSMLREGKSPDDYAKEYLRANKKGISGYAYFTVPAVIYTCMYHDFDFEETMTKLIRLGGDTDTCCAIAGSLCGIAHGTEKIPKQWKTQIKEFPVSINKLSSQSEKPLFRKRDLPVRFVRNMYQLGIVLTHGFRRLLPTTITKIFY